jgi:GNAT superfamily N-acetyltransferase
VIRTQTYQRQVHLPPEIQLRPWSHGDEVRLRRAGARLSQASLNARFCAGVPALPKQYLRLAASAPRWRWDAQVAVHGGELIGWAEFARMHPGQTEAELAVTVVDAWQRRGIGTALVEAMLPRCVRAGIRILTAEIELSNVAARAALAGWLRAGHRGEVSFKDGFCHVTLPLVGD